MTLDWACEFSGWATNPRGPDINMIAIYEVHDGLFYGPSWLSVMTLDRAWEFYGWVAKPHCPAGAYEDNGLLGVGNNYDAG